MPTLGAHPSTTSDRISTVLHPLLYAQERALNEVRGPLDEPRLLSISGWLQGEVSIAALRRALDWLTERHTVLRTTFEQGKDGSYGQFVQTEWLQDFLITRDAHDDAGAISLAQKLSQEGLDPGETCFRVGLVITLRPSSTFDDLHPAIYDHWSAELLLGELSTLYDAACKVGNLPIWRLFPSSWWIWPIGNKGSYRTAPSTAESHFGKATCKTPLHQLRIPADRYPGRSTAGIEVN